MTVTYLIVNVSLSLAGSEARRHNIHWSVLVHRKWNYFSLAGGMTINNLTLTSFVKEIFSRKSIFQFLCDSTGSTCKLYSSFQFCFLFTYNLLIEVIYLADPLTCRLRLMMNVSWCVFIICSLSSLLCNLWASIFAGCGAEGGWCCLRDKE